MILFTDMLTRLFLFYNPQLLISLARMVLCMFQCFIKRLKGRIPDYDVIFLGIEVRKARLFLLHVAAVFIANLCTTLITVRTILVLGYWVLGDICRYWTV